MNTDTTIKKRVAIVTGASSDMGLGITQALLQHGYCVVANSRNISKSKDLKPSSDLILVEGDIGKRAKSRPRSVGIWSTKLARWRTFGC